MSNVETIQVETIQQAKDRLGDEIVTCKPTGDVTNIQSWRVDEETGEALAWVVLPSLRTAGWVASTNLVEFGYQEALNVLATPSR